MLEQLIELDENIFLGLNGLHTPFWDDVMYALSGKLIWLPLYLTVLIQLIILFRKKSLIIILALATLIGMADYTASKVFKPNIKRFRPTHELKLQEKIHTVNNYKGGTYGFFSSHASISYVFTFFLIYVVGRKKRYYYMLLVWATIVSYSRIYLGVHYPLDILAGALCGFIYASIFIEIPFIKKMRL
jgi:undecaprenyl-diphosphatase